jgi:penicillin-binding protein 1B
LPAAGKTGTSRDAWFAGFTSKLIAVVWVGFDDNRDFKLEGAQSALPIWTEFMKRAHTHPEYKSVHEFEAPDGIVTMEVDDATGEIATAACPKVRTEVFIAGSQPLQFCHIHNRGGSTQIISGWDPVQARPEVEVGSSVAEPRAAPARRKNTQVIPIKPQPKQEKKAEERKRGFWERIFGR